MPSDVPVIREPFTAEELRGMVNGLLAGGPRARCPGRRVRRYFTSKSLDWVEPPTVAVNWYLPLGQPLGFEI